MQVVHNMTMAHLKASQVAHTRDPILWYVHLVLKNRFTSLDHKHVLFWNILLIVQLKSEYEAFCRVGVNLKYNIGVFPNTLLVQLENAIAFKC